MTPQEPYVVERCAEIERILKDAASWASNNDMLGANLAAYITVLIVGTIEDSIEHLVKQRVARVGDTEIENYIGEMLDDRFRNPDYSTISGLLGKFSKGYKQRFQERISYQGVEARALEGLLGYKNSLAHLGTCNLQMTLSDVDGYYHQIIPILEALEQILA